MIQRVQTLYLLAAGILTLLMIFFPLVEFLDATQENGIILHAFMFTDLNGIMIPETHYLYSLGALIVIATAISFISVGLFKKRNTQIRLCIYNIILLFALLGIIAYYSYLAMAENEVSIGVKIAAIFPLIAIILTFLALVNIRKDEAIVKSLDRIR